MKAGAEERQGWGVLLRREWLAALAVLLGGILLHSMNVLMLATVLPTIVGELGGASLMSLPSTAFLASSIVAATCAGLITATFGARNTYCAGAAVFSAGAVLISLAPAMGWIIAGRFVQGFGGGLIAGVAYVLVRSTFPEAAWARAISLLSGMWSVAILVGPLVGGVFARYGHWRGAFVAVAAIAVVLTFGAFRWLPSTRPMTKTKPRFPGVRLAFICAAIASASSAAVTSLPLAKAAPDRAGRRIAGGDAAARPQGAGATAAGRRLFAFDADRSRHVADPADRRRLQPVADLHPDLPAEPARPRSAVGRLRRGVRLARLDGGGLAGRRGARRMARALHPDRPASRWPCRSLASGLFAEFGRACCTWRSSGSASASASAGRSSRNGS